MLPETLNLDLVRAESRSIASEIFKLADQIRTILVDSRTAIYLVFLTVIRGGVPATMLTVYPFLMHDTLAISTRDTGYVIGAIGVFAFVGASFNKFFAKSCSPPQLVRGSLLVYGIFSAIVAVMTLALLSKSDCLGLQCHQRWAPILALFVSATFNALICLLVPAGLSVLVGFAKPELAGTLMGLHSGIEMGLFAIASCVSSVALKTHGPSLRLVFLLFTAWSFLSLATYVPFFHDRRIEDERTFSNYGSTKLCSPQ